MVRKKQIDMRIGNLEKGAPYASNKEIK